MLTPQNVCTNTLIPGYRWVRIYQPGSMTYNHFTIEPANTMDVPFYDDPILPPYYFQIVSAPPFQFSLLNVNAVTMKDQVDGFAVYGHEKKNDVFLLHNHDVFNYNVYYDRNTSSSSLNNGQLIDALACEYSTGLPAFILVSETVPTFYTGLYVGSGHTTGG